MSAVLFAGGGTGGHLYPALALGEALHAERPDVHVHFAGAQRGVEARVLPQKGVPHTLLPFEPIRRDRVWRNWRLLPGLARSIAGLRRLFATLRPGLVVGTGGYASGPACMYAVARGVPVALQEQNSWPGFTTRTLARWARQVHLGFPEAQRHLKPGVRTRVFTLGNPIRPPDTTLERVDCRTHFGIGAESTVVLVVGGSQGSRAVNDVLTSALGKVAVGTLPAPPTAMELLWATGPAHIELVQDRLVALDLDFPVHAVGYIDEMPRALAASDLAVSRAGAMATAELLAWGIPALLVPLPTAAADHQTHNAVALEQAGAAVCLRQADLTPERLWSELTGLVADEDRRARMEAAARARAHPNAAREIARHLLELLPE